VTDTTTRKSVLVVEDDELLNGLIVKLLNGRGLQTEGVVCGRDAIDRIIGGQVDVLLLDQQLPDMTGQDVISVLSLSGIRIPFVVMTGQGDERLAVDMMKFGAADYLVKDNNLTNILPGVIERALRAIESERLLHSAENALKESEKRFRSLFQDAPAVAVQGYSADGTVRYWNKASEKLYGYAAEEAIGRNLLDLMIPEAMRADMVADLRHMMETGEAIPPSELVVKRKDGSNVTVLSSYAVLRNTNNGEPEIFCIDVDLTARQQAEFEREHLQAQLTQAQKMEAVGRLAGGVAHDFNNMLGVIFGHTELLISQTAGHESIIESLNEIRTAAQRSADLTRQLLAFARKQNAIPKVLDLNQAVESMLKMLRRLIGEGIRLTWESGNTVGNVRMDPSQIDQILANLCVNARDAISDTGNIIIKTAAKVLDAKQCLKHADFIPGEYAVLTVSDDGCGMDEDTLKNIFEPFFTTKPIDKGTGLGLATVYGIVRQNNGFIAVRSEPGKGTEFEIYLPQYKETPPSTGKQRCKAIQHHGHERILLVEDNKALLEMISTMLRRSGYEVIPANSPHEAIALAHDTKENIDLLVTDVIMPGMNGHTLFGNIEKLHPETRCLFMSGYTADVISQHGVLDEGVHFLEKPFVIKDLMAKINDVMRKNQSHAEQADSEQDFV